MRTALWIGFVRVVPWFRRLRLSPMPKPVSRHEVSRYRAEAASSLLSSVQDEVTALKVVAGG